MTADGVMQSRSRAIGVATDRNLAMELVRVTEGAEIVAHLSISRADFWVADDPSSSPEVLGGGSARMILTVDDPDTVFGQAIAAGGTVINAIYEDHGWRIGRLADPFGHHWEIGKPLSHLG
jgi:PhnB protein